MRNEYAGAWVRANQGVIPRPILATSICLAGKMRHIAGMNFFPLACLFLTSLVSGAFELPSGSSQCVVGLADGWNSSHVTISYFEKKGDIWRREGAAATAGCTTMYEDKLRQLIAAVDPSRRPLYVLLPSADYKKLKPVWKLP